MGSLFSGLKLFDLSVHGHVLSFGELEILSTACVNAAVGMDGRIVDQRNVLPYDPDMAVVFFQQLAVFHIDIGFGAMAGRFFRSGERKK